VATVTTGRKPVKCKHELLKMANRGEPLRITPMFRRLRRATGHWKTV